MTSRSLVSFMTLLAISNTTIAGEKEDQLIAKLTQAYGGQALLNLKSYTIVDHYLTPTTGQSHTPSLMEVSESRQVLNVDIDNNRASYDTWSSGRSGSFQGATISDGEKAYSIKTHTCLLVGQ